MDSFEILVQLVEIEKGVIPSSVWYHENGKVNQGRWGSLSSKDKKIFKRKFRKILRKACRKYGLDHNKCSPSKKAILVERYFREFCEKNT